MDIDTYNALTPAEAQQVLLDSCYCEAWAVQVEAARPFANFDALMQSCLSHWSKMKEPDFLGAFSHHAKIGDVNALKDKFSKANAEQGQITAADDAVIEALYAANQQYESQNGFIFIVCATGKSADEMLAILKQRLKYDRETELSNAAIEQAKILTIRLSKQFSQPTPLLVQKEHHG